MVARPGVIIIPVEIQLEDVAKGLLQSVASIVYAVKTGTPVDFRGNEIPPYMEELMNKTPDQLEEIINGST